MGMKRRQKESKDKKSKKGSRTNKKKAKERGMRYKITGSRKEGRGGEIIKTIGTQERLESEVEEKRKIERWEKRETGHGTKQEWNIDRERESKINKIK